MNKKLIIKLIGPVLAVIAVIVGIVVFANRDKKKVSEKEPENQTVAEASDTDAPEETEAPTESPTPTEEPTSEPTSTPTVTEEPTETPMETPTEEPTETPTPEPTEEPTNTPTPEPTKESTPEPTKSPTKAPTVVTPKPTNTPVPTNTTAPVVTKKPVSGGTYQVRELTAADDKSAPMLLGLTKNPTLIKGNAFNITKYISYCDDVCRDVHMDVNGSVDINTPGDYPLVITLTDDAGHSTVANMKVTILEKAPESGGGGGGGGGAKQREEFSDFIANYKTDKTMVGIDVSRWQENIDFAKVKAAGCEFVMIRLGGDDDGSRYTDKYFENNIKNAKAAGLKVGLYWHAEENSIAEVKKSTEYLLKVLNGQTLDLPIAYDWEDFSHFPSYKMSMYDLNACFEVFCDELEAAGYEACLYSSKNPLGFMWTNERNHPVWVAHYVTQTNYTGSYFMWQHSSVGNIDGIKAVVDLDVLYLDR